MVLGTVSRSPVMPCEALRDISSLEYPYKMGRTFDLVWLVSEAKIRLTGIFSSLVSLTKKLPFTDKPFVGLFRSALTTGDDRNLL